MAKKSKMKEIFEGYTKDEIKPKESKRKCYIVATYLIKEELNGLLKREAYWERKKIKQVINEILEKHFKDKNIKPIPGE